MQRTHEEWLNALQSSGEQKQVTLADLREIVTRSPPYA
jgi:hypothetical protein